MPRLVSEIAAGQSVQRSSEDGGVLSDAQTRVFRVVLNAPGEGFNIQNVCGVKIGDPHPVNANVYCVSWDAKFEGDSRTVFLITFNYRSTPASAGGDRNETPPTIRPANWSTSTSLMEVPARAWAEVGEDGSLLNSGQYKTPVNPVGDVIDGVSALEAVVTITAEQYCISDPTVHCCYAGSVNSMPINIGTLSCPPGSLMFRGVQTKPTVEAWGDLVFVGWSGTFEFAYRPNFVPGIWNGSDTYDAEIGWDIAVPQTGFSVKMLAPAAEETFSVALAQSENIEAAGYPLRHESGKIKGWPDSLEFAPGTAGKKARSMTLIYSYQDGGASQLPSAQPIPLNDNGTPRAAAADPPVIVRRYRTAREINFATVFGLRLP